MKINWCPTSLCYSLRSSTNKLHFPSASIQRIFNSVSRTMMQILRILMQCKAKWNGMVRKKVKQNLAKPKIGEAEYVHDRTRCKACLSCISPLNGPWQKSFGFTIPLTACCESHHCRFWWGCLEEAIISPVESDRISWNNSLFDLNPELIELHVDVVGAQLHPYILDVLLWWQLTCVADIFNHMAKHWGVVAVHIHDHYALLLYQWSS